MRSGYMLHLTSGKCHIITMILNSIMNIARTAQLLIIPISLPQDNYNSGNFT